MEKSIAQHPKIYIIILNYNGWQDTIECVESILKNTYSNFQIIIVDNDSPNDSMKYIESWAEGNICNWLPDSNKLKVLSHPSFTKSTSYISYAKEEAISGMYAKEKGVENPIIMIQAGENKGFSAGNNIGIQYVIAKNDANYLMVLNNDTVVEKNFLLPLLEKSMSSDDFGIVGPKIMHYEHPDNIFSNGAKFNPWTSHITFLNSGERDNGQSIYEASFLSGAAWFIPVSTVKEVGLLDERYFMYMEDVDFTEKVRAYGKRLGVASDSKIYHKGAQSSGGGNSDFSIYWISKNQARYILNNLTPMQKISAISYFFYNTLKASLKSILKGKKIKVKIAFKGFFDGLLDRHFRKGAGVGNKYYNES